MTLEETTAAVAGVLANLARLDDGEDVAVNFTAKNAELCRIQLPGLESIAKSTLEQELTALARRIQQLEFRASAGGAQKLPVSPDEPAVAGEVVSNGTKERLRQKEIPDSKDPSVVNMLLAGCNDAAVYEPSHTIQLTHEQLGSIRNHISEQDEQIKIQRDYVDTVSAQLRQQQKQTQIAVNGLEHGVEDIGALKRELLKHQQANLAFQKALQEIGNIVTAVAAGDLSKKVLVHSKELDPEITTFKRTINKMVDQLQDFAGQVTQLAKEVGTEGRLGLQCVVPGVSGIWAELTSNVNIMAENLTDQVREIAVVTTAVAHGDLSRKIERPAKGEILQLQCTINVMVDQLRTFATEVTRVARDVGVEGVLGGQVEVQGVQGMWNDLTTNVNAMANNLTAQVRDIAKVTTAVAKGDLTQKVSAICKGEILDLKLTINSMVDQLQQFAQEVTKIAREVGDEGRLGGQATVHGVEGTWKDLTQNVNIMANKLTTQVREIAEVTTAVAKGDLTKKVTADVKGEILDLKITINSMVDRLGTFAFEVSKVAREVGTEGTLGGQAMVENVEGKWKDLTENVNTMAQNLTGQVRSISDVTQAIARGDMKKKIEVHAKGEILVLKSTINDMVERLDRWSLAVKRVARDVGVDGKMGGQIEVMGDGRWKEITVDVNTMAQNLTSQVRAFANITSQANFGDFTQEITVEASGEMDELKRKINKMVSGLRESFQKNTKAREAAELANKIKSEFLANMSHEIRTPMNGILGMTQLTLDTELTNYQREYLNIVHSLANSLLTIIDDILDISKIEANRMELEQLPFSLRGTVFNALKTLAVKANERDINLGYQVDNSIPDYVIGDALRLRQIIVNLVGNAVKFTEHGEVKVTIGKTKQDDCGPNEYAVEFAVSDTGIGIHGDKLNLIFDTFQQADGSTTRKFGGTGLGLSISKKLVHLMRGQMWVDSDYGRGSTFFFTCKVRIADTDLRAIRPQLSNYKKHAILFLDEGGTGCADEIIDALKQLDLVPHIQKDWTEKSLPQTKGADGHAFACVIVDSNKTARRLRSVERFKYIPVVMLAQVVSVSFKSALEDGISSYMTVPCSPIDLGNALIPALEGRATAAATDQSSTFDILLAEDNIVNQRLAVKILEKYHHTVTVANNGLEAFEQVQKKRFDVVLMDVQMPIMGGFEATAKIREFETNEGRPRTPIIALTAHAMMGDREKCIQAQMDDYLSKPLKQNMLVQTILKCAAMNGSILEHKTTGRMSLITDLSLQQECKAAAVSPRPLLKDRGITEQPHGLASPTLKPEDQPIPIEQHLLLRSHSTS